MRSSTASFLLTLVALTAPALTVGVPETVNAAESMTAAKAKSHDSSLLEKGRELFFDQRYEESIQTLSAALLRPNLSKVDRIEVYRFLAYNYITLGRLTEADSAVRGLFSIAPTFQLGENESPRFRSFFDKVRKKWEAEGRPGLVKKTKQRPQQVVLQHASPAKWERGKSIPISGKVAKGRKRVSKVVVYYRTAGTKAFHKTAASLSKSQFHAVVPARAVKPPMLEYYIEAVGNKGVPIANRGDAAAPMRVSVPREEKSAGILASPWFWTAAGVIVAGGAATTYLLTRDNEQPGVQTVPGEEGPPMSRVIVTVGE